MAENNSFHIKLKTFYISEATRVAIGMHLFKPYKIEIENSNGDIGLLEITEYDGKLPPYLVVTEFLNRITEDFLSRLEAEGAKNLEKYREASIERKNYIKIKANVNAIKRKMELHNSILGKVTGEIDDTKDKTS